MTKKILTGALSMALFISSCTQKLHKYATDSKHAKGLKDYYRDYFTVGVEVAPRDLRSATGYRQIFLAQEANHLINYYR